jgi:hypothetical protein
MRANYRREGENGKQLSVAGTDYLVKKSGYRLSRMSVTGPSLTRSTSIMA